MFKITFKITFKTMFNIGFLKHLLVSLLAGIMAFGFVCTDAAWASSSPAFRGVSLPVASTPTATDWITQLETEILPQIEQIFNSEQREQFQTNMTDGMSFRKAFKSLVLTPEQKKQLKTVLNSVTKKDALASLTPDQKKQLYMKKKELFKPTAEEITERIETSLKEKGMELPEGVKEKIDAGIKMKDNFIPSAEAITEKIEAGMNALKDKLEE